jgi:putative membrane protein
MNEQVKKEENKVDLKDELAKERTRGAFDRTMMAWVRTALALIGFGIGIFEFASKTKGETIFRSSEFIGILLIVLGVVAMFLSIKENKTNHERLSNPDFVYVQKISLAVKVGYALIVIGIIGLINMLIKFFG